MFSEMKDKFERCVVVDDKEFMFANVSNGKIIALVRNKDSNQWKSRFFRYSESDHQWKALPGEKPTGAHMKGEESHSLHHYVQSVKLDKDIYNVLERLPQKDNYDFEEYIPKEKNKNGEGGQFENELEFKEKFLEFKDKEWSKTQGLLQAAFKLYNSLIINNSTAWTENYKHIKTISKNNPDFQELKECIDIARNEKEYIDYLKNPNTNEVTSMLEYFKNSENPKLKQMAISYEETIGSYIEKIFQKIQLPEDMNPDFNSKPENTYFKGEAKIEEYRVQSKEGDEIIFAMAQDTNGRVYIDNIYNGKETNISDYGTYNEICQMGYLVFKPEDYSAQTFGILEKYKKTISNKEGQKTHYTDISGLWENIPVINEYKKTLNSKKSNEKIDLSRLDNKTRLIIVKRIKEVDKAIREELKKDQKGKYLAELKKDFTQITKTEWSDEFQLEDFLKQNQ